MPRRVSLETGSLRWMPKRRDPFTESSTGYPEGLVRSCHDCSDGGWEWPWQRRLLQAGSGWRSTSGRFPKTGVDRNDLLLFSESQSRFVVTLDPSKKKVFEAL